MAFKNRERVSRRLARLPELVRAGQAELLEAQASELVAAQRQAAPVQETGGGELRDSIRDEDNSTGFRISRAVRAGGAATTRVVRKGAKATYDYALAQELGTEKMPANPFFYPPYRAKRAKFKRARLARARKDIKRALS